MKYSQFMFDRMMDLQGFWGLRGSRANDNGVVEIGGEFSCCGLLKLACREGVAGAQRSAPAMKDSWCSKEFAHNDRFAGS